MSDQRKPYPIGRPGTPWSDVERVQWRSLQRKQRDYGEDVVSVIERLRADFDVVEYGSLDYDADGRFPLYALKPHEWDEALPCALVTGGVHGYETSGVHGALQFTERHARDYAGKLNVIVAPCVSPWAYERINRWNAHAIDPNRSFKANSPAGESAALMQMVAPLKGRFVVHIDLHETTDTDESEFRPALAARDGKPFVPGTIPDGFYLVDDTDNPQPAFHRAIIDAVAKVTHIAPADPDGTIIGSPVVSPGVIRYAFVPLGLCAGVTGARFATTTEVYPDSPKATPEQCNKAQVAAARAALDFAVENG
ncbi:MAG: M14 family metallocarboxypeptidase [Lysobacteraceae bacterium]